ncbi:uncharacterized protein LOC108048900 [Drosophila rhopaloa]|uniref:Uncharacterized protein LOC108048900 n=1 Tax=Drosophila rhopaloa TaxID=1041015 RepID=A0A6P4F4R3_DRORH|nr:uncharacterized protein LOC108048900 [Drosophila rhopaloa]
MEPLRRKEGREKVAHSEESWHHLVSDVIVSQPPDIYDCSNLRQHVQAILQTSETPGIKNRNKRKMSNSKVLIKRLKLKIRKLNKKCKKITRQLDTFRNSLNDPNLSGEAV